MLKLNQLEHSNRLRQRLLHSSNLPLQRLKPRHSQLRQKHKPKPSQRHSSLQLSSSSNNLRLTQPVTIPATTTELTITTEAKTLMLALERVMLAVSLRDQPSNEPRQIACNARTLQICKSKH